MAEAWRPEDYWDVEPPDNLLPLHVAIRAKMPVPADGVALPLHRDIKPLPNPLEAAGGEWWRGASKPLPAEVVGAQDFLTATDLMSLIAETFLQKALTASLRCWLSMVFCCRLVVFRLALLSMCPAFKKSNTLFFFS
jgi:hypothetical protein